jgi:hypothetical protein
MRAAGGTVTLRRGSRRDEVRLEELPANQRAPVLRAWYGWTALSPVPRRHFKLERRAPVRDFERIAPEHPVFRIVSARPSVVDLAARKRVTRDVAPSAMRRLLDDPPRASVAFVGGDAVELLPARTRSYGDVHEFGVLAEGAPDLEGREVVLLMDGGAYWFELRGVSVRGVATRGATDRLRWYGAAPQRVLAWDYDTIREE